MHGGGGGGWFCPQMTFYEKGKPSKPWWYICLKNIRISVIYSINTFATIVTGLAFLKGKEKMTKKILRPKSCARLGWQGSKSPTNLTQYSWVFANQVWYQHLGTVTRGGTRNPEEKNYPRATLVQTFILVRESEIVYPSLNTYPALPCK